MNVRATCAALIAASMIGGSLAAAVPAVQAPAKKAAAAAGKVIEMTGDDTMKFNVIAITAKPGEQITVRLKNVGTMPKMAAAHNFVLLAKAVDMTAFTTAAVMAGQTEYIPAKFKDQVVAFTKLVGPGETAEVSFKAPTAPGEYDYICSFPGHFATMKGKLTVK